MGITGYINVSLETFGGLLSLIFIICVYITHAHREAPDRLYIRLLLCNTVLLFCDAAAWLFKGRSDLLSFFAVRISNFLVYILGYLMLLLFTHYLVSFLFKKGAPITKAPLYTMIGCMSLAVCLVVLSQFNGMYYIIDGQNVYHRQGWFWLSQVFGIAGMLFNSGLLLVYRKRLNRLEFWTFAIYIGLPVAALFFQILIYGIAVLYLATTACLLCIYISIQMALSQEAGQKELELEKARTAVMLSQIQPHFLYNALIGIKELCDTGERQAASKALEHFAYYLRGNLDSLASVQLIPFEQEVSHVKDYLYLEKIRFEDRLNIVWELTDFDFLLPPLTLQPIVENAVRHGITEKRGGGTLTICSERSKDQVIITVKDDGVGFNLNAAKADHRTHVGLENVKSRLQMQCGGRLAIESRLNVGTTVKIMLPRTEVLEDENSSGRR